MWWLSTAWLLLRTPDADGAYTRAFNYHRMEITRSFHHPSFLCWDKILTLCIPGWPSIFKELPDFVPTILLLQFEAENLDTRVLIVQCFCFCSGLTVYYVYTICKSCAAIVREHFFTLFRMPIHSGYPLSAHRIVSFSVWANTPGLWASLLN